MLRSQIMRSKNHSHKAVSMTTHTHKSNVANATADILQSISRALPTNLYSWVKYSYI